MRVAINTFALSARLGMAGSGRYILELVRALVRVNTEHELLILGNADNRDLLPTAGCRFVDCGPATLRRPLRLLWEQTALPWLIKREGIDVLHSPVFVAPLALPCASVVSILDMTWFTLSEQHTRIKRAYFRFMIPRSARRATRIIAISEASRQDVVAILGIPAGTVGVTYLGVDLGVFHQPADIAEVNRVTDRYGIHRPYVLYVGKLEPRKNLPALIRAFAAIADKFPDYQLVLAGNPGWDCQAVYRAAEDTNHLNGVCFTGFIADEDLSALYAGAKVFIYPSSYEGFGFPVIEAMACGVPVITSNVSSLPEVAGRAALLVTPSSEQELADALARVLADEPLYTSLQTAGRAQAQLFTWEETARRTLAIYTEAHDIYTRTALKA